MPAISPLLLPLLLLPALAGLGSASPLAGGPKTNTRQASWTVGQPVTVRAGTVRGGASRVRPEVSAYLGIPFAQPPTGQLRFMPPVAVASFSSGGNSTDNSTAFDASDFGPDCPSNHIPTDQAYIGGPAGQAILTAEAQTGRPLSEDCLSLNVWTKPQSGSGVPKAVLFWIFGGGFSIGNTACEIYDGSVLADENDVVVIEVLQDDGNRRVVSAEDAGLQQNVGLLDQRMALEWARDNVAAFGGDPSRITVFGQSAGGASTDYLNIMYPDDPIANGFIPQSGVASGAVGALAGTPEDAATAWYDVSASAGCGGEEAGPRTVDCMRMKTTAEILGAVDENDLIAIQTGFSPVADDITAPSAAVDRINAGDFAKVPMLVGNVENEAGFIWPVLLAYTYFDKSTVDTIAPLTNLVQTILDIANLGVTAYRYRFYGGNYTNLYVDYVGSDYHTSELPVVFGTASWLTGIQDTPAQASMGAFMRNAWAEFARDPEDGLANLGWPKYDPNADTLARLAFEGEAEPSYVDPDDTDTLCTPINFVLNRVTGSTSTVMSCLNSAVMAVVSNGTQSEQVKQVLASQCHPP
ncbi:hypothetical protein FJTKL_03799 [Diaporthe vaccinii]|uniref:Carboxylic ester hydrolase n=1 Tax=Diaporthe vaccinii TaxID=105482 RepID=A0ABR4F148_9PEZI